MWTWIRRLVGRGTDPITTVPIGERARNERFAAEFQRIEYDIEGPGGINPGSPVYRIRVVVSNPNPASLRFEAIEVTAVGINGNEHYSSFQHGEPGKRSTAVLLPGQGFSVQSTHPENSVGIPSRARVSLVHDGNDVGPPIECIIDPEVIAVSEAIKAMRGRGPVVRSSTMFYCGPSLTKRWDEVTKKAHELLPRATLRLIEAAKWSVYGDPDTCEIDGIEIGSWLFAFVEGARGVTLELTDQSIDECDFQGVVGHARKLLPLPLCKVDIVEAIQIAASQGNKIRTGPNLRVFKVAGKPTPLWIMPGVKAVQIDALTGNVVDPNLIEMDD